ncbi:MAG: ABC transporter permease [Bacteroidaceae bacterium]|nr:ABC transporter permease [Bacteroidaceae bacterium]
MRIFDADQWEEIADTLSRNKTRTFLTAFGIFWGVFMLILLMGGGRGLVNMLGMNFAGFASNSGFFFTAKTDRPYKGLPSDRWWTLEMQDAERVRNVVPEVDVCAPCLDRWGMASRDHHNGYVHILGHREDYHQVDDPKIRYGRAINDMDDKQQRKVCVIGSRVVQLLFPELGAQGNPVGSYLSLDSVYYQIVGVSGRKAGGMQVGGNPENTIELPLGTMRRVYNRGNTIDMLCMTAREGFRMSDVQDHAEQIIKRAHRIHPDDKQALKRLNTEAIFSMVDTLFQGVRILVWMIGLGTLLAGAIGVSNIMVIAVKERTVEIGIRRAIGATPRDILWMVMTESIVLTLVSGMGGITLSVLILQAIENSVANTMPGIHFQISFGLAVTTALLLSLLGVMAGLAPAIRAMKIRPVEAMREE